MLITQYLKTYFESQVVKQYGWDTDVVYLFIYLFGVFYVAFNTVQVISRRVVGRAEETST